MTYGKKHGSGTLFVPRAGWASYVRVFLLVSCLFLLWGFASGLLDNLNKHFQNSLSLLEISVRVSSRTPFIWAISRWPFRPGWIARRLGYKGGILPAWRSQAWARSGSFPPRG